MNSRRTLAATKWFLALSALAGIVLVYRRWLHVNPTTVALTLLLLVLLLAANWGLRYAVAISFAAAACYNFFFLPPLNTFTIADTQNWIALFAFLSTAITASRLAQKARDEADDARTRQRELEILFQLSREILQSESLLALLTSLPSSVIGVTGATFGMLYLLEGDRLYQAGSDSISEIEIPHFRQLSTSLQSTQVENDEIQVPLRSGVRPKGLLLLRGATLSPKTADALGGLISIAIDRALALESVARNDAAKESERLRTLMIDSITHALRTPLTSIKGAATTLLQSEVSPDDRHELLSIIDEESDRLNLLVSEAVQMAQLDAQQVQMHFEPVNVRHLVNAARDTCSWIEDQHSLQVQIDDSLAIHADGALLEKVICNLLENAAKYSNAGTPIIVRAERNADMVAISVADRGIGIDSTEQALIFERFYRGRFQEHSAQGTGMGLAISRAIVEAHGGTISVVSQPAQGSVFTINLPAANLTNFRANPTLESQSI